MNQQLTTAMDTRRSSSSFYTTTPPNGKIVFRSCASKNFVVERAHALPRRTRQPHVRVHLRAELQTDASTRKFQPFVAKREVQQLMEDFKCLAKIDEGTLVVCPLSSEWIVPAADLLTEVFADSMGYLKAYRKFLRNQICEYLKIHLTLPPKAVVLVALVVTPQPYHFSSDSESESDWELEGGNYARDLSETDSAGSSSTHTPDQDFDVHTQPRREPPTAPLSPPFSPVGSSFHEHVQPLSTASTASQAPNSSSSSAHPSPLLPANHAPASHLTTDNTPLSTNGTPGPPFTGVLRSKAKDLEDTNSTGPTTRNGKPTNNAATATASEPSQAWGAMTRTEGGLSEAETQALPSGGSVAATTVGPSAHEMAVNDCLAVIDRLNRYIAAAASSAASAVQMTTTTATTNTTEPRTHSHQDAPDNGLPKTFQSSNVAPTPSATATNGVQPSVAAMVEGNETHPAYSDEAAEEAAQVDCSEGISCSVSDRDAALEYLSPGRGVQLVGTVELSFNESTRSKSLTLNPPQDAIYLCNMAVDPRFRRRGIGLKLLEAAENLAVAAGERDIYLHLRFQDKPAAMLYERGGYNEVARDMFLVKLMGTDQRYLMHKRLRPFEQW